MNGSVKEPVPEVILTDDFKNTTGLTILLVTAVSFQTLPFFPIAKTLL